MYKHVLLLLTLFFLTISVQAQQKNWKLVWSDEFNYNGLPDNTKWDYENGFVRNKEPQYFTTKRLENCRVENGMLIIEARKENYPNAAYKPGSTNWNEQDEFAHYTSASIITKGKKYWKYGRMEVRAKVPAGLGTWPAVWLLGANRGAVKWPFCGEVDIVEFLGRDSTRIHGTVHYADSLNIYRHQSEQPVVGKPADGFHIYAVEWNENQIAFYYDNLEYFVFDYKKAAYNPGKIFQRKFYLLLDLALGHKGSWAGPVDDKILPCKYMIDYVRVYQ